MSIVKNAVNHELYPVTANTVYENTSFTSGPIAYDLFSVLGKVAANRGYIKCDGPGNITIQLAHSAVSGTPVFGTAFTLKSGDIFDLTGCEVHHINVGYVTNSAYRINAW